MTLPASGSLSMSQINSEFGRGNNLNAYRGTTWYTDGGSSGTFTSSSLGINQFYSKRLTSPTFSFTISSNQTNANLRTLAVNAGWNQSSAVIATIGSGVYISSNSTGTAALTVNGSFPSGVQLVNNGYILGMGGNGGNGATTPGYGNIAATAGASGGLALSVSSSVSITNNGTIGGGGGGGGGGCALGDTDPKMYGFYWNGGGGGGGRSSAAANSSGGTAASGATAGSSGTSSSAGGGGNGGYGANNRGGDGGGWGSSGSSGSQTTSGTIQIYAGLTAKSGGGGGAAVSGNGYISWVATGTRLGGIS